MAQESDYLLNSDHRGHLCSSPAINGEPMAKILLNIVEPNFQQNVEES